nr:hypothetical protein [Tanacetum cinerariifolium]
MKATMAWMCRACIREMRMSRIVNFYWLRLDANYYFDNSVPVIIRSDTLLMYEDEDPEEDRFKEEEDPQEKEDDMEVDIKEDKNEPKLTYPYKEMDPLNPAFLASESEPEDAIEVKGKQEKDKIGTNPNKNGKRRKA